MKKVFIIFISAVAVFYSCVKESPIVETVEYIDVPVRGFVNDIELTAEVPLTKASKSKDVYGIQVYTNEADPYYSGMYDDISLCKSIKLVKGVKYRIISVYIPNAKNYYTNLGYSGCWPFCPWSCDSSFSHFELNTDYYNSQVKFDGFSHELLGLGYNGNKRNVDYYVFKCGEYIAEEGKTLDINYLRYNADITINFSFCNEHYDNVKITTEDDYYCKTIKLDNTEKAQYKITNHMLLYCREEEDIRIIISTEDGKTVFYDGNLQFKRNKNRVYELKLESNDTNASLYVTYDDNATTDEAMGSI